MQAIRGPTLPAFSHVAQLEERSYNWGYASLVRFRVCQTVLPDLR